MAKKVREHDGFRWFSATDEARVLKHSDQGREVSSYEVHEPGISFSKPPAPVAETFYVIDGTIRCIQGAQTREFKRGDLGFVSYEQETEVSYSDGLRFLRLVWPVQPGGEHREMSSLSVFDDHGPPEDHNGRPAYTGVVHQSPDLRHLTLCSRLPEGARYTHDSAGVSESFYLVAGTIEVVSSDRGAVEFGPGDFVSVPESGEFELEFSAGVNCVCWFWSDQPLPMLVSGRR